MDALPTPPEPELARLLLAADASVDPHRVVRLCCEHCHRTSLSVSLIVAADDRSRPWAESGARAEMLLRRSAKLLEAEGFRVENLVLVGEDGQGLGELVRSGGFDALVLCAGNGKLAPPILPLAARLARLYRLPVLDDDGRPLATASAGWLRRVVDPLLRWPRSWESSA